MGETVVNAVDGISFEIAKGEFVIIVGPSGAGKSTVLNILGGMDGCTSGRVTVDGARVDEMDRTELIEYRRFDIGFVFQFYNLMQNLTALENVELATQIADDPMDPAEALMAVGLSHRMDNFPSQLSGGYTGAVTKIYEDAIEKETSDDNEIVVPVEITLESIDDDLKVGYTVNVELTLEERRDVIWIPLGAMFMEGENRFVYIIENDEVIKRQIVTGFSGDRSIEVLEGLSENDILIANLTDIVIKS